MEYIRNYLDFIVFGILGLMSFLAMWFAIERFLFYRKINLQNFKRPEELQIELTKNLTLISSIGSNAPYIGLLGTVFGIMLTFYDMGQSNNIDTQSIMVGLALALKATAMGLFVAIPAIIVYNGLLRRVDVLIARWNTNKLQHETRTTRETVATNTGSMEKPQGQTA